MGAKISLHANLTPPDDKPPNKVVLTTYKVAAGL